MPWQFPTKLLLTAAFAFAQPVIAAPRGEFVEGEVIVTYRPQASLDSAKATAGRHTAKLERHFAWLSNHRRQVIGVVASSTKSTAALIADLQKDPDVLIAEPNYLRRVSALQPNDPLFPNLWALKNIGQTLSGTPGTSGRDIRFLDAWNLARPSTSEVVVAVMDTGLDTTHPDIAANLWTNGGEIPRNGIDDDANGRIDDLHGFSFVDNTPNVADSGDHGTHVAGTVAATGNNALGIIGTDFKARVMPLKISADGLNISTSAVIAAIDYAAMMKSRGINIVAINASYGGHDESIAESTAITAAGNVGIVFCAAAGNEAANNDVIPTYPANHRLPNMIVVAASTQNDTLASFSNFGATTVDLAAPGDNIYSLKPTWLTSTSASVTAGATDFPAIGFLNAGTTSGITATLIDCGTGNSPGQFPPAVAGNIALIQRGIETFATKINHAMNAGAVAAIIYNNVAESLIGTLGPPANYIPAVGVTQADGNTLLTLVNTPVTVTNAVLPGTIYQFLNGTSMACPHVAAAVAFAARNFPGESPAQRVARILNHTTPVAALSGKVITGGRLDLLKIIDTNGNQLPDWWETDHFGVLGIDAAADPDGDGQNNLGEYLAGTNPNHAASRLFIASTALLPSDTNPPGDFTLTFPSVPGIIYRVEFTDSLAPPVWTHLPPDLIGTGGNLQATDSAPAKPFQRFYRVRVIP